MRDTRLDGSAPRLATSISAPEDRRISAMQLPPLPIRWPAALAATDSRMEPPPPPPPLPPLPLKLLLLLLLLLLLSHVPLAEVTSPTFWRLHARSNISLQKRAEPSRLHFLHSLPAGCRH
jgi:hypothetical protein